MNLNLLKHQHISIFVCFPWLSLSYCLCPFVCSPTKVWVNRLRFVAYLFQSSIFSERAIIHLLEYLFWFTTFGCFSLFGAVITHLSKVSNWHMIYCRIWIELRSRYTHVHIWSAINVFLCSWICFSLSEEECLILGVWGWSALSVLSFKWLFTSCPFRTLPLRW